MKKALAQFETDHRIQLQFAHQPSMSLLCNKEKLDPEEDDDLLYEKLRKQGSFLDDLLVAVYEVRLVAPFVVLACLVMAYHLFIAPYNTVIERMNPADINLVHSPSAGFWRTFPALTHLHAPQAKLRPVLTKEQQLSIRETVFWSGKPLPVEQHRFSHFPSLCYLRL